MTAMEQAVMERMGYLQRYKVSGGNVAFCKLQNFGIFCLTTLGLSSPEFTIKRFFTTFTIFVIESTKDILGKT